MSKTELKMCSHTPLCQQLGIEHPILLIHNIKPAGQIVQDIVAEAEAILEQTRG